MTKSIIIPHSRPCITELDRSAVRSVLSSGMIAQGNEVLKFERAICHYLGTSYAVAQSSGTAALILALKTLGINFKDEVIIPTYVCRSVLEAVLSVGAIPILCDVDDTGVITIETINPKITNKTKAIIGVHIFGHPCNIQALKQTRIPVIEDSCQAFGSNIVGIMSGTIGDIGVFSFHATKCLTTGEGGMLVTRNINLGERARELVEGCNIPSQRNFAPISDMQGALGISQLNQYTHFLNRRIELKSQFIEEATKLGIRIGAPSQSNMLFRFTIRTNQNFEEVQKKFGEHGVSVRRGVDELLHRTIGINDFDFPNAVKLYDETVSVPFYPSLNVDESKAVCNAFKVINYAN